jgi:hypothetical protein
MFTVTGAMLNDMSPAVRREALGRSGDGLTIKVQLAADWPVPGSRRPSALCLPKSHPCRLSGMPVLVEDAAEAVSSLYLEAGGVWPRDGRGQRV